MGVNGPEPAFFWDDTTKSWRKPLAGEPGEYTWNPTTNSWEFGSVGAEYKWNSTTRSWDFGPGGQYVYNHSTRSWDKVTSPGYGGPFYWDESTKSWLKNTNAAQVSDAFARWDFINNQAWWSGAYVGGVSLTPNWTFARASAGYAQNQAGLLIPFASGELRRTDKGVLIEGARTNLCLQSQTFDNASWTKSRTSISANAAIAPDGTTTAGKLIETVDSGTHRAYQTFTKAASAVTYTLSVYLKAAERTFAHIRIAETGEGNPATVGLNLSTGELGTPYGSGITGVSAAVVAVANGWYRLSITGTTTTDTNLAVYVMTATGLTSGDTSYVGDITKGVYIWGTQLEAASFPSSYIPTTTASATRAADALSVTSVTGLDYPLSLFAEFERAVDTGTDSGVLEVNAGSSANRALLNISTTGVIQFYARASFVDQVSNTIAGALATGTVYKVAARVSTNDSRQVRGGTLGTQDTSCTNPAAPTKIIFGAQNADVSQLHGYLRRLALFSRALSDGELQALTAA